MAGVTDVYMATMAYQAEITATKLIVEFNGTRYEVPRKASKPGSGNPDFYGAEILTRNANALDAPYPFCILREDGVNVVYVNGATGTTPFTLKIIEESLTTTECFNKAVKGVSGALIVKASYDDEKKTNILDKTAQEIYDAFPNVALVDGVIAIKYSAVVADSTSVVFDDGKAQHEFLAKSPYDYPEEIIED